MSGAHWGGGLAFDALMPEMRDTMGRFYVDSAATGLLYSPDVVSRVIDLVGAKHVLFGTDFPLVSQAEALDALREAAIDEEARALIEGANLRALLRLADGRGIAADTVCLRGRAAGRRASRAPGSRWRRA